jgi:hypothetical protein
LPLPEVLVDAASGLGDDYIMPDLAHDTRQMRMLSGVKKLSVPRTRYG